MFFSSRVKEKRLLISKIHSFQLFLGWIKKYRAATGKHVSILFPALNFKKKVFCSIYLLKLLSNWISKNIDFRNWCERESKHIFCNCCQTEYQRLLFYKSDARENLKKVNIGRPKCTMQNKIAFFINVWHTIQFHKANTNTVFPRNILSSKTQCYNIVCQQHFNDKNFKI